MGKWTAISIKQIDRTNKKSWRLEIEIFLHQKQVLGSGNRTEEARDMKDSISKMYNGSEVITQRLSFSGQSYRSFQKLPDAPEQAECKTIYF
jgi:hypothetical protein